MPYIYRADMWCDDCGQAIRQQLDAKGDGPIDPDRRDTYDSDDYPKGPFVERGADCPVHCGAGERCINAVVLPSGDKIGALLSTDLTAVGVAYVQEAIDDGGEVAKFWQGVFSDAGYDVSGDAPPIRARLACEALARGDAEATPITTTGDGAPTDGASNRV